MDSTCKNPKHTPEKILKTPIYGLPRVEGVGVERPYGPVMVLEARGRGVTILEAA